MKVKSQIAFVICTEKGRLEEESVMLVKTLRKYGGEIANATVYSFQPRKGTEISIETKKAFKALSVIHIEDNLNSKYESYPFSNKIFACDYVERLNLYDKIVFLDSDKLILSELKEIYIDNMDLGVRPVEKKGIGTSSQKDENSEYWEQIYHRFHISNESILEVTTSQTFEDINAYWNAGLVVFNGGSKLCQKWLTIFEQLMEASLFPKQGITFMDQVALAILSLQIDREKLVVLPNSYNYPLNEKTDFKKMKKVEGGFVTIHYHRVFEGKKRLYHPLDNFEMNSEKLKWLKSELKATKLYPKTITYYLRMRLNSLLKRF